MQRREALRALSYGTLGLWLSPASRAAEGRPALAPVVRLDSLEDLARRIRQTPRERILKLAAEARGAGADTTALLGAVFLAGLRDIRPWHVGGKLHAVMMVESTFLISAAQSERDAWLAALWNLDDFKRSQARDVEDGDWVLGPRPEVAAASEGAARKEFLAAMDAWDHERADRAIVALLPFHDRESLFELLWPLAARSFVNIGHKIIYAAQLERTLRRIDWKYAEPALRSLVMALLFQPSGRLTAAYERSVAMTGALPDGWMDGEEEPDQSATMLRGLRTVDRKAAQDLVVTAFREGLGPRTVWDGLRLRAAEVFLQRSSSTPNRREALLPVHAVTVVNAFGHAWRASRSDRTRRLMVLQASAWLDELHAWLDENVGLVDGKALDQLRQEEDGAPAEVSALFEQPSAERARVFLEGHPQHAREYVTRLQGNLIHRAVEHHQHKYAAAFAEEATLAHPRWASLLLAPAMPYMPPSIKPATEFTRRALASLD